MSKRSRDNNDDEAVPDVTRSARVKREGGSVSPDAEGQAPTGIIAPQRSKMGNLLLRVFLRSNDPEAVSAAVKELADMLDVVGEEEEKKVREEAIQLNSQSIIIATMEKWRNNEQIQYECCRWILNLFDDSSLVSARCDAFALGALELLVAALRRFPDAPQIQENGIWALANMFSLTRAKGTAWRTRFVRELNGVGLLVGSMKRFSKNAEIHKGGCQTFYNISFETPADVREATIKGATAAAGKALEGDFGDDTKAVHHSASKLMKELWK